MKHRIFMIIYRNSPHEIFFEKIRMFDTCHAHILKYYSHILVFLFHRMINNLAIILRSYSGKHLLFCFRYAQSIESVLYLIRHIFPAMRIFHWIFRFRKKVDWWYVKKREVRSPFWIWLFLKQLKSFQSHFKHPIRIIIGSWYQAYHFFWKPNWKILITYVIFYIKHLMRTYSLYCNFISSHRNNRNINVFLLSQQESYLKSPKAFTYQAHKPYLHRHNPSDWNYGWWISMSYHFIWVLRYSLQRPWKHRYPIMNLSHPKLYI